MITALQMALAACQNLIFAGGVVFRGWSPATALTLYWCENLVGSLLLAGRIALHRRLTRKRGHYRPQINARDGEDRGVQGQSFLSEFATLSLAFCLVHGIFLVALSVLV